jgi:adenylosuccinate synthase
MFTGPTALAVLHLDTLSGLDVLKVCVRYKLRGTGLDEFPSDAAVLEQVEPVYHTLPGWSEDLGACRHFGDLPVAAREYVRFLSDRLGVAVRIIGVGPSREQVVRVGDEV